MLSVGVVTFHPKTSDRLVPCVNITTVNGTECTRSPGTVDQKGVSGLERGKEARQRTQHVHVIRPSIHVHLAG